MFERTWYSVSYRARVESWEVLAASAAAGGDKRLANTIRAGIDRQGDSWTYPWISLRFRDGSVSKVEAWIKVLEAEKLKGG